MFRRPRPEPSQAQPKQLTQDDLARERNNLAAIKEEIARDPHLTDRQKNHLLNKALEHYAEFVEAFQRMHL